MMKLEVSVHPLLGDPNRVYAEYRIVNPEITDLAYHGVDLEFDDDIWPPINAYMPTAKQALLSAVEKFYPGLYYI